MNYPNSNKTYIKPNKSTSNRGMSLEEDINITNKHYLTNDVAIIYKKPTPVQVVDVDYPKREAAKIKKAFYKLPSTTDYNGIYKGRYIDFEAKECSSKTSFSFSLIQPHQIKHLEKVLKHGAIAFVILRMTSYNKDYLIKADDFIDYYKTSGRKSMPYSWIEKTGYKITYNYIKPCDYLKVIQEIFEL